MKIYSPQKSIENIEKSKKHIKMYIYLVVISLIAVTLGIITQPKEKNPIKVIDHPPTPNVRVIEWKDEREIIIESEWDTGLFTAYNATVEQCGKSDGITTSGARVEEGETLACPAEYPIGTKITIRGYGTLICQDRGGAIKGKHFDIYMDDIKDAKEWGNNYLTYRIK